MTAKTPAERIASLRQRHKDAGRVPVTVWVLPAWRDEVRALEAKLHRREARVDIAETSYAAKDQWAAPAGLFKPPRKAPEK